eukprot:gnl/MRDRNA2_/MRDRNA2_32396_c0_seq1.p1 gnl/MRDRNA2_/MRDRNA2_32396_c0~~gnl/MRDRNA2_/MRDRNA2_32396_c0_seq1.p1  ORF type:complete len:504 (+),score=77.18 gnl/MRDRNA2_/MRDRNA2_32396_c0_seq1:135-1646(+)
MEFPEMLSVSNLISKMRLSASVVTERMNENFEDALNDLFNALDEDQDGQISRSEFRGMSLHAWAALRAFTSCVNCLPKLPSLQDYPRLDVETLEQKFRELELAMMSWGFWDYINTYVSLLFLVHCGLGLIENIRYYLTMRCTKRFPDCSNSMVAEKASKEEALQYDTPLQGAYEIGKTLLFVCSGMAFFRLVTAFVVVTIGVSCINVASQFENKRWQTFWFAVVRQVNWVFLFFLGYSRVNVEGTIAPRTEVKLLVANHCAVIEIFVLYCIASPSFVAAVENLSYPFFGGVVRASKAILVDRHDPDSKKKTLATIKQRAEDASSPQLMIFPEGTLSNHRCLFKFKVGPFVPKQPVQPVLFKFPYKHFNPCWTGEAVGGINLSMVLLRTACQFVNRLDVKILPVYRPSEEEVNDVNLFTRNVENLMAMHLGLPTSEASLEDYSIAQKRFYEALENTRKVHGNYNISEVRKRISKKFEEVRRTHQLRRPSASMLPKIIKGAAASS